MLMDPTAMPEFSAVFNALKNGQHLAFDNDNNRLWHAYRQRPAEWCVLFREMGFDLREEHDRYCYLAGDGQTNAATPEIAVFMLVIIRHLARSGEDVVVRLTEATWTIGTLPHLADDRSLEIMAMIKVTTNTHLEATLRKLAKLGFVRIAEDGGITFCSPVRRFLAMCIEAYEAEERGGVDPADGMSAAPETAQAAPAGIVTQDEDSE